MHRPFQAYNQLVQSFCRILHFWNDMIVAFSSHSLTLSRFLAFNGLLNFIMPHSLFIICKFLWHFPPFHFFRHPFFLQEIT